jgi:hypothetical protein
MDQPQNPRRSLFAPWRWPRWTLILLAVLMLLGYPLSIGPIVWLGNHAYLSDEAMLIAEIIYLPIEAAGELFLPIKVVLNAYRKLWGE